MPHHLDAPVAQARPGITDASTMDEAIEGWMQSMTARGVKPASVERMASVVKRCSDWTGWAATVDITYESTVQFLAAMRRGTEDKPGWSGPTYDQAVSSLRTFGEYLRKTKRIASNVLEDLEPSGETGKEGARALTLEQARALVAAAIDRHLDSRRAKGCAPFFWVVMLNTGLRYNECCELRWRDIDLHGEPPAIYTDPKWAKAGRRDRIVLSAEMTELLPLYRETVPHAPEDRVFPVVPVRTTFTAHCGDAAIPKLDGRGRAASMHSLRKTYCTLLDGAGVPAGVVSKLARHAAGITQKRYIDPPVEEELAAIAKLPRFWPEGVTIFARGWKKKIFTNSTISVAGVKNSADTTAATPPTDNGHQQTAVNTLTHNSATTGRPSTPSAGGVAITGPTGIGRSFAADLAGFDAADRPHVLTPVLDSIGVGNGQGRT